MKIDLASAKAGKVLLLVDTRKEKVSVKCRKPGGGLLTQFVHIAYTTIYGLEIYLEGN